METAAPTDAELLADWLAHRRESAFHALVSRYAALVHLAAKRACDDDSLAAEASQLTFILLARKAKSLGSRTSLGGWLHLTAVGEAKNLLRSSRRESRKRALLQTAMDTRTPDEPDGAWQEIQPFLNDALAALSEKDREALLLRFYRSLSVREIAATLGVATDAAQKRIDRATERLRGKLARRGCQAGGSLGAVMLAGFAADAEAAVPAVSLLTSKAIAAGAAGAGIFPGTGVILTTAMKATSLILPFAMLILAGTWIGTRRESISALDRQSDFLAAMISSRATTAAVVPASAKLRAYAEKWSNGKAVVDWNDVAAQLGKGGFHDIDRLMFEQRLQAMSKEELLGALDDIALLTVSEGMRRNLEEMVVFPMSRIFPGFTVMELTKSERVKSAISRGYIVEAMETWPRMDYEKAAAWLDQQISAGTFDTTALDGKSWARIRFESALVRALLKKEDGGAASRLNLMPTGQRKDVLMSMTSASCLALDTGEEAGWLNLVRTQLPAAERMDLLVERAQQLSGDRLSSVSGFLERIEATPDERLQCVEKVVSGKVAGAKISNMGLNRTASRDDIAALREWMGKEVPDAMDRCTGESLGDAIGHPGVPTNIRKMSFSEAADFAVEFNEAAGNDEVLAAFLKSGGARTDKTQSRVLAGKISDETLRAEILKTFE